MDIWDFPFALIAFFGFVAFVPAWVFFVYEYPAAQLMAETHFIAQLVLPTALVLFILGWIQQ